MFRNFTKYEIFLDGRIWSYSHNKWMKPTLHSSGYYIIGLSDNDGNLKTYRLHRVVYESVTGQPIPEGLQVNHINEDKSDNRFENLNLMTPKENTNWGTHNERVSKALSKQVAQYDKDGNLINVWPSTVEVQKQLGFYRGNISNCCNGKRKSAHGFIWKFAS